MIYLQMISGEPDRRKFEAVYQKYRRLMFSVANKILPNERDAEDAVHQSFIKIAENITKVAEPESPRTRAFVALIAERTALDMLRAQNRRGETELDEAMAAPALSPGTSSLAEAMARLPAHYRQAIILRYAQGYSTRETAALLGMNAENTKKLLQRAKEALKTILEEVEI